MPDRTNATRLERAVLEHPGVTASTSGVLRPDEFARHVELVRRPASAVAASWVENHWALRWDLPEGRHFPSQVLAHPTCSLTLELGSHRRPNVPDDDDLLVTGVSTRRFDVDVRGWGLVVGVRFRPGGLAALTGRPASEWTDRVVRARDLLPGELCATLSDRSLAERPADWAAAAEDGLAAIAPAVPPGYDQLLGVVADMLADRSLVTVAEVADRHGMAPRTLQRLFNRYIGVGPKWMLARYRMHDIVSALDAGYDGTLTDLAHRHGWYDQAHFTREFVEVVGVTPGSYRGRSG